MQSCAAFFHLSGSTGHLFTRLLAWLVLCGPCSEKDLETILTQHTMVNGCSGILSLHTYLTPRVSTEGNQNTVETGSSMQVLSSAVDEKSSNDSIENRHVKVAGHTPLDLWREQLLNSSSSAGPGTEARIFPS